jgi:hypothetical protein
MGIMQIRSRECWSLIELQGLEAPSTGANRRTGDLQTGRACRPEAPSGRSAPLKKSALWRLVVKAAS